MTAFFISATNAQTEYRVGLGLYEVTQGVYSGVGLGHPHPFYKSHQILSNCFFERQNDKITHRLTARYINHDHTLKNSEFRPFEVKGRFKRTSWDIGYNFLYSIGKQKCFSFGLGIAYLQGRTKTPIDKYTKADLLNRAFAPNVIIESNIKLNKSWFISPSIQWMNSFYFQNKNFAPENPACTLQPRKIDLFLNPIRISIKKTISRESI